jgi:hypothetical protein
VSARVTDRAKACRFCTEPFRPRRSDALFCSNAHRQAAYRRRKRAATDTRPVRLTPELREYLRRKIDRRRRAVTDPPRLAREDCRRNPIDASQAQALDPLILAGIDWEALFALLERELGPNWRNRSPRAIQNLADRLRSEKEKAA